MPNPFLENRKAVQKAAIDAEFLYPLTKEDLPLEVIEDKLTSHIGSSRIPLKKVVIRDVPVEDEARPKSWVLNLEIKEPPIFANPPSIKTVEKALIVMGSNSLFIFLIEMKSSLHAGVKDSSGRLGIGTLKQKVEDSISRISTLIPLYVFDETYQNLKQIKYKALIFYNRDDAIGHYINTVERDLVKDDLYKIWANKKERTSIISALGTSYEVEFFFFKNPEQSESFEVQFEQFFNRTKEHGAAIWGDQTCPVLLMKK